MADFEPLDDAQSRRVERWLVHRKLVFVARVLLAQSAVRSALAQSLSPRLDPANPATPEDRLRLLAMRGDAIKTGNRAIAGGRLAFARLGAILNLRRDR
jgi:hypothetical protein